MANQYVADRMARWCKRLLIGILGCWIPISAYAYNNNLQLSGTIVSPSCVVSVISQNQTVPIGDFSVSDFKSVGSVSALKEFTINITGCSSSVTGAKVTISGEADPTNSSLLALSDTGGGGGMATGVGVDILDSGLMSIPINTTDRIEYPLHAGSNTMNFALRYKATVVPVTAGNASAVLYFDLTYQ